LSYTRIPLKSNGILAVAVQAVYSLVYIASGDALADCHDNTTLVNIAIPRRPAWSTPKTMLVLMYYTLAEAKLARIDEAFPPGPQPSRLPML
jgi:hypothetical protein